MDQSEKPCSDGGWLNHLLNRFRRPSLFLVLAAVFVVQIIIIIGITGYISYRQGRHAVNDLAAQLMIEVGRRIDQNLSDYMGNIEKITRTNASLVQSGILDPGNKAVLKDHFREQLRNYEMASTVAIGTEKRDFMALERDSKSLILREYDKKTRLYTSYRLNDRGEKTVKTGVIEKFDPLNDPPHDPWYQRTKARGDSSWLLVVTMAKGPDKPELMIVNFLPIYDKRKQMLGVAASSIYLSRFGNFLTSLKIGKSGQAFLVDKEGNLIATSTGEIPFLQKGDGTYAETMQTGERRVAAIHSKNRVTSASARFLANRYGNFDTIDQPRQFTFRENGTGYLIKVIPTKKANLEWLTVVAVPERDFMEHINRSTGYTLMFFLLGLVAAIITAIFTARWVTKPILSLNRTAKMITRGEWDEVMAVPRSDEIGELTGTFNTMAEKMKTSFDALQKEVDHRKRIEESLRVSEKRFRHLLYDIPSIAIQGYRLDGTTTYWNKASELLYGYTEEETLGNNLLDLIIPPETRRDVEESMKWMVETGRPIASAEINLVRKDGSRVSVFSHHSLVQLPGEPVELFCLDVDLTKRKEVEQQLLFTEFSLEHSGVATMWFDRSARVVRANEAACQSLGYSRKDLLQMKVHDFDPDFQSEEKWQQSWEEMKERRRVGVLETRHRRNDGSVFPVAVVSSFFDYTGEEYVVSFAHDISARKEAEEEILREKEKLKTLSDNAPFGMALIDKAGNFTYISKRFTTLFGFDLSDIPDGRTWCRKAYPNHEYRHAVISTWLDDMKDAKPGEQKPRIYTVTCKNGAQKIVQFIFSVLMSGDYLMTSEDITAMRHLESQLRQVQKMEAIGTLAGGIAHDFNNILSVLMGYATLLKMKIDIASPLQPYVDEILTASRKAADLTKGLLTFSRQQAVTLVPLDINQTIKTTEKLLKRLLTEDIVFRISLAEENLIVMSDSTQMDQILFNLVANARDAMPRGGVLSIETEAIVIDSSFIEINGFGNPGRYTLMRVSDSGIGMDETTRENIFNPFFTTKEIGKGTGLGLATVYGIVKHHNGFITVDSRPNQGTSFHIYLPIVDLKADKRRETATPIQEGKETILIAEDNEELRRFMREGIRQFGYTVIEATDGEDAVDKFRTNKAIDLIIIDSVMPKKNGREAYEEIRSITPHIKALFTSGYTKDIILDKGIKDKEFDFIAKPMSLNKLMEKIREILDRK